MDENELRLQLAALRSGIDEITRDVRDLKVSVHGSQDLNIGGVDSRITQLETKQEQLKVKIECLESERNNVRSWLKGAGWVAGSFLVLLGVGGGFSINRILILLRAIAEAS